MHKKESKSYDVWLYLVHVISVSNADVEPRTLSWRMFSRARICVRWLFDDISFTDDSIIPQSSRILSIFLKANNESLRDISAA